MLARMKREGGAFSISGGLHWHWFALGILVLLLAIVTPGCGGGGGSDDGGDSSGGGNGGGDSTGGEELTDIEMRSRFIQTVGNGFILPTYTDMETAASDLVDDAEAFCAAPNRSNLDAAQAQWRQVIGLWVQSELVGFGPAKQDLVHNNIDAPRGGHADATDIESRIEGRLTGIVDIDADNPAFARSLPLDQRGLEGVEYLLFGDSGDGATILDTSDAYWNRRCDYLQAIVVNLHANIAVILTRWQASDEGGEGYVDEWNSAGEAGNSTYRFVQDAIDDLINEVEFVIDNLVNSQLGGHDPQKRASRRWVDGKPESWRSGNSLANIRHRVEAAEMIFLGTDRDTGQDGFGIDEYLQRTGEAGLATEIRNQFGAVYEILDDIPGTLEEAVETSLAIVRNAETESRDLLGLLKRDMAEHLDVFFGFNDADGD